MTEHEQQLMMLRGMTATTGVIHEAQLLQLKYYGAVAFDHLGKGHWRAEVNIEDKMVSYHVEKKQHPKELPMWIAGIDRSVHWLLGPEWSMRVVEGDRVIYQGQRVKRNKNAERRARKARAN